MADQLIRVAAEREFRKTDKIVPPVGLYEEFCAKFKYNETEDQLRSIEDTLIDFSSGKPMDRLVCGDVGFGKTAVFPKPTSPHTNLSIGFPLEKSIKVSSIERS